MEGYRYPLTGPMAARPVRPRYYTPRFQFRAPGVSTYQATTPQSYHPRNGLAISPSQGMTHYQRGVGPIPAPSSFAPHGVDISGVPINMMPVGPPPRPLTHRVVIPPPKEVVSEPNCTCERKVNYLLCSGCGFLDDTGKARARRSCPVHPKHITYTDLTVCPSCFGDLEEH